MTILVTKSNSNHMKLKASPENCFEICINGPKFERPEVTLYHRTFKIQLLNYV